MNKLFFVTIILFTTFNLNFLYSQNQAPIDSEFMTEGHIRVTKFIKCGDTTVPTEITIDWEDGLPKRGHIVDCCNDTYDAEYLDYNATLPTSGSFSMPKLYDNHIEVFSQNLFTLKNYGCLDWQYRFGRIWSANRFYAINFSS